MIMIRDTSHPPARCFFFPEILQNNLLQILVNNDAKGGGGLFESEKIIADFGQIEFSKKRKPFGRFPREKNNELGWGGWGGGGAPNDEWNDADDDDDDANLERGPNDGSARGAFL